MGSQSSNIKHIRIVVQPSPPSIPTTLPSCKTETLSPSTLAPVPLPQPLETTIVLPVDLTTPGAHVRGNTQCPASFAEPDVLRCMHAVGGVSMLFLRLGEVPLGGQTLYPPTTDGCLGSFHPMLAVSCAAVNMRVQGSLSPAFSSWAHPPGSGAAGLCGGSTFNLLRNSYCFPRTSLDFKKRLPR